MKRYFPLVILVACTALFAAGVLKLFELRFEAGDVYAPYSTLRADPLGTMAFYESLGKIPGISVRRDFSVSNRLPQEPGAVYMHLAAESYEWEELPEDLYHEIDHFVRSGGRLVITYLPQTSEPYRFTDDDESETNSIKTGPLKSKGTNSPPEKAASKKKRKGLHSEETWVSLDDKWGFHEHYEGLPQDADVYEPVRVFNRSTLSLPKAMDWHSGLTFTNCDTAWQTIYARGDQAVMMERKFGKGSVVMASDSYFLSNEALAKDRHADLLAWLVGAGQHVVFDEAHLGTYESSGVAGLMRQYRLHGLAAGLLLLAGLFIWKNSTSLVPPHAEEKQEDFVAGKNSAAGFVNLLRRNISSREIFEVCFNEWKKTVVPAKHFPAGRLQQAEAIFQAENALPVLQRDPVNAYKQISETLGNLNKKL